MQWSLARSRPSGTDGVCPVARACRMDVIQEIGHDAGGRKLPAVLLLLGEVERIRELATNSPYSGIVPEIMGQRSPGPAHSVRFIQGESLGGELDGSSMVATRLLVDSFGRFAAFCQRSHQHDHRHNNGPLRGLSRKLGATIWGVAGF